MERVENHLVFVFIYICIFLTWSLVLSQNNDDPVYSDCGGDITTNRGLITSPVYPSDYPNSQRCTWRISNEDDVRIRLTFNDLEIENSRNCQYDYLSVVLTGRPDERLCGSQSPSEPLEGALPAVITFSSDGSVGGRGFSINFQVLSPCLSEPCLNGGTCQDSAGDSFNCSCIQGWEGSVCEIEIDECLSNPCQNDGTCEDHVGFFSCACSPGVSGQLCDVISDHCLHFEPCVNGGTCENNNMSYVCLCLPGYTGTNCESDFDECNSNPCQNGGSCMDEHNQYVCSCPKLYLGDHCETIETTTSTVEETSPSDSDQSHVSPEDDPEDDPCFEIECLNGGSCVVLDGGGVASCICLDGYEGLRCQDNKTISNYFVGMLVASCLSVFCMLILAGIVYYLACKQASATDKVESMALQQQVQNSHQPQHNEAQQNSMQNGKDDRRNLFGSDADYTLPHQVQDDPISSSYSAK